MTLEELFLNTATFLANQTKPCVDVRGECVYAGQDGNACGVGCNLPRDLAERLDALAADKGPIGWKSIEAWAVGGDSWLHRSVPEQHATETCQEAVAVFDGLKLTPGTRGRLLAEIQAVHDETIARDPADKIRMIGDLGVLATNYHADLSVVTPALVALIEALSGAVK